MQHVGQLGIVPSQIVFLPVFDIGITCYAFAVFGQQCPQTGITSFRMRAGQLPGFRQSHRLDGRLTLLPRQRGHDVFEFRFRILRSNQLVCCLLGDLSGLLGDVDTVRKRCHLCRPPYDASQNGFEPGQLVVKFLHDVGGVDLLAVNLDQWILQRPIGLKVGIIGFGQAVPF